ncbi:MAG TPA: PEGA domain-containing protein [Polyangiaceae bacterium]|jgi:hypothetical protein
MRRGAALGLMLVSIGLATPVHAQPAEASALTRHGLALRRERRDAEALEEFRRAYALDPAPRTLAQIALAEQALGRWADAEADLEKALRAADDRWIAANRSVLGAGLAAIRGHLGSLDVDADATGAELWVNGARIGALPLPAALRVEAGSVVIEVRAPGHATARRMTSVEPGESARESVHLVPLAPPAPSMDARPPPAPRDESLTPSPAPEPRVVPVDRPMRATAWVLLGAGMAGLASGAYFGVRTLATRSDRDGRCQGPGGTCTPLGLALDGEARSLALRSTAWFAGGLVAAGVGAGLFLLSRSRILPGGVTALRLGVDLGPDRATGGVGGSW